MPIFDRIECIVGDSFFFQAAEKNIEHNLIDQYNISRIEKEIVSKDDSIEKFNSALLPNIFDIEPKIVVLRNIKYKLLSAAINSLKTTENVYLIIEIEENNIDGRVKILKELEKNKCLKLLGFAYYNDKKSDNLFNQAISVMGKMLNYEIKDEAAKALYEYVPKIEYEGKPIHNLPRIFMEFKKLKHISIPNEEYKNLISQPQIYYNLFDISQSLFNKNMEVSINIIDNYVIDAQSARQLLALIMSEIKIICLIKNITDLEFSALYKEVNEILKTYEILDDSENINVEYKSIHPYRLQKILEKKNSSYFKNCDNNLKLCIDAHNDLNYYYQNNFKIPLIKLCAQLCSD